MIVRRRRCEAAMAVTTTARARLCTTDLRWIENGNEREREDVDPVTGGVERGWCCSSFIFVLVFLRFPFSLEHISHVCFVLVFGFVMRFLGWTYDGLNKWMCVLEGDNGEKKIMVMVVVWRVVWCGKEETEFMGGERDGEKLSLFHCFDSFPLYIFPCFFLLFLFSPSNSFFVIFLLV